MELLQTTSLMYCIVYVIIFTFQTYDTFTHMHLIPALCNGWFLKHLNQLILLVIQTSTQKTLLVGDVKTLKTNCFMHSHRLGYKKSSQSDKVTQSSPTMYGKI